MSSNKIRGCLVGGLVGDCLGSEFEGDWKVNPQQVNDFFANLQTTCDEHQLNYSDDSAMTFTILQSLYRKGCFDAKDMAQRFTDSYFKETFRGYGSHVIQVFKEWKTNGVDNVYEPALKQFGGAGSFGNGGAMRIAPIAIYCYNDQKEMAKMVTLTTELTHANPLAIMGALIQCSAVRYALGESSSKALDANKFLDALIADILILEKRNKLNNEFSKQLGFLKAFLQIEDVIVEDVVRTFGNSITAQRSVVMALYCFFRGSRPVKFLSAMHPFDRVIQLAIAMGGDTDTIACMAGAIAGSYYGYHAISSHLYKRCEGLEKCLKYSAWLHSRLY